MSKRRRRQRTERTREQPSAWRTRLAERVAASRAKTPAPPPPSADAVVIHPRLAPEGLTDALVALGAGLLVVYELLIPPGLVWRSVGEGTRATALAGVAVFVAEIIIAALTVVHRLKLDARGIHFSRRMGRPKFIPWADVTVVRRATRGELVLCGWIWPPLWPNEATRSMTSVGHFAIAHRHGVSYFPPVEETAFLAAVRRWGPRVRLPAWEGGPPAAADRR
jgi:hypothetical protein